MIIIMNTITEAKMENRRKFTIPPSLIQEADELSKATKITFRDCLEILVKSYLSKKRVG